MFGFGMAWELGMVWDDERFLRYCCVLLVGWRYVLAQRLDNCQEVPGGGLSVVGQAGRVKHDPGTEEKSRKYSGT